MFPPPACVPENVNEVTKEDKTPADSKPYIKTCDVQKWLVLLSAILCRMLSEGYAVSMGILFVEFLETFRGDRGSTMWAISVVSGIMYGAGVPTSLVLLKTNERVACVIGTLIACTGLIIGSFASNFAMLLVFFGITTGVGMSFIQLCYAVAVNHHFNEGKEAALAICETGSVIGGVVFPVLLRFVIDVYGWRGAVLISAGILLNMIPLGVLFVPRSTRRKINHEIMAKTNRGIDVHVMQNSENTENCVCENGVCSERVQQADEDGKEIENILDKETTSKSSTASFSSYFDGRIWRSLPFVSYVIVVFLVTIGNDFPYDIIVDIGTTMGYSKTDSTYLVMALNLASAVGTVIIAVLLKLFRKHSLSLFIINACLVGLSLLSFPTLMATMSYEILVVAVVLFGIFIGGVYGTFAAAVAGILGRDLYAVGFGVVCTANGIGVLLSAPLAGWVNDLTGDYVLSFYIGAGISLFAILMFGVFMLAHRQRNANFRLNKAVHSHPLSSDIKQTHVTGLSFRAVSL